MGRHVRSIGSRRRSTSARSGAERIGTSAGRTRRSGAGHAAGRPEPSSSVTCRVVTMLRQLPRAREARLRLRPARRRARTFRTQVLVVFDGKAVGCPHIGVPLRVVHDAGRATSRRTTLELWPLESSTIDVDPACVRVRSRPFQRTGHRSPADATQHPKDRSTRCCDRLGTRWPGRQRTIHGQASDFLFEDDLWDPTPANTPPTATVPEDVTLSLNAVRILVACSVTCCRERDDFQPGKLGGVGRLYPHVMVVATALARPGRGRRPLQAAGADGHARPGLRPARHAPSVPV